MAKAPIDTRLDLMDWKAKWQAASQTTPVRYVLIGVGCFLIALTPLVGPIPGPGGVVVFAAGLSLVLKYSGWAKRLYVRFKKKHPNKGRWADWGLRRASAARREELLKAREMAARAEAQPYLGD
ncbi:MAG TPA: hypothetical protein VEZ20_07935 [Allosphingosinicella sp.]|nr:hypothetical protein [Allosphingosinicella sp.]